MDYFGKLPLKVGCKLIYKIYEKKSEKKHWDMWIAKLPYMDKDNYLPFEKFYNKKPSVKNKSRATKEDLLKLNADVMSKIQNGYFKKA